MNALLWVASGMALFGLAYRLYGRHLSRQLGVDDTRPTPATTHNDGVDYVPTPTPVVFGHHFSSIAGAGPIVGPIIAGLAFGWLPALLWVVLGAVFFGGVHDFTTMFASLRNGGRTLADICRLTLGRGAHIVFLLFVLFALIYVIIVFLDLTALGFAPSVSLPALERKAAEARQIAELPGAPPDARAAVEQAERALEVGREQLRRGGAVATASLLYIALAVLFGLAVYRGRWPLGLASWIFVPLVFAALWVGQRVSLSADVVPEFWGSAKNFWVAVLLVYCAIASVLPVWLLLQPRDYLSSFLLYGCLLGGLIGLIGAAVRGEAMIRYPALVTWNAGSPDNLGFLYPALFITVACGAISGFHSMVASGTTARQLRSESAARVVGYGGMLVEGVLALLSLATVMILAARPASQPVAIFADGLGRFLGAVGVPARLAGAFGLLAVSTFLLTTLDTCTRLSRFVIQELFGLRGTLIDRLWTTAAVLAVPALVVFRSVGGKPAWQVIWPAFGASNQLMAALALLVVYGWLRRENRRAWYVAVPMGFMTVTTLTALLQLALRHLGAPATAPGVSRLVGGISVVLIALALWVIASTFLTLRRSRAGAVASA